MDQSSIHFLDALPFDWTRQESRDLHALLAQAYFREADLIRVLHAVRLPPSAIRFGLSADLTWRQVLEEARRRLLLRPLLDFVANDPYTAGYRERFESLASSRPPVTPGAKPPKNWTVQRNRRKCGDSPALLQPASLERALLASSSVARLRVWHGQQEYLTTAFLIDGATLLTCRRLFVDDAGGHLATRAEAQFGYELGVDGQLLDYQTYRCDPSTMAALESDDWATVGFTDDPSPAYKGLARSTAARDPHTDKLFVIFHPAGGPKQIAVGANGSLSEDGSTFDFLSGVTGISTGTPILNDQGHLVALHSGFVDVVSDQITPATYRHYAHPINTVFTAFENLPTTTDRSC